MASSNRIWSWTADGTFEREYSSQREAQRIIGTGAEGLRRAIDNGTLFHDRFFDLDPITCKGDDI